MLRDLQRYLTSGQLVEIIYLNQQGQISQRKLRLYSIDGDQLKAYCLTRSSIRSFSIKNILALASVKIGRAG
ncbi:WYL domain-containing protein [Ammoniphilus sp. 3BR4]|uniref:WYL domain-containing protein n=1 Tax=Ammoniphilus sp. 3BR4 TaxID=3158265 RepID=UPI003467B2AA